MFWINPEKSGFSFAAKPISLPNAINHISQDRYGLYNLIKMLKVFTTITSIIVIEPVLSAIKNGVLTVWLEKCY